MSLPSEVCSRDAVDGERHRRMDTHFVQCIRHKFFPMAIDIRSVSNPKPRLFIVSGSDYGLPPLNAPVDAKPTNDGISFTSSFNPSLIMSPTSLSSLPSS